MMKSSTISLSLCSESITRRRKKNGPPHHYCIHRDIMHPYIKLTHKSWSRYHPWKRVYIHIEGRRRKERVTRDDISRRGKGVRGGASYTCTNDKRLLFLIFLNVLHWSRGCTELCLLYITASGYTL